MEYNDKDNKEIVADISKVTPKKKKALGIERSAYMVGLVCLILIAFMIFPHKEAKSDNKAEHTPSTPDYTLSENLALIDKMRAEENKIQNPQTASAHNEDEFRKNLNQPPQLRHKRQQHEALSKEIRFRMNAQSSFDIATMNESQIQEVAGEIQPGQQGKTLKGGDANSQFLNAQTDITTVVAQKLPHPEMTIPAGEMIPATLEVAVDSDLAGMVRAITARNIYSLEGANILIPRGSTLVGQFSSAVLEGQSRIFIVWNRVQMNDGVIVSLNSPSSDQIGRAGLGADYVDTHFWQRFGTSSLLSVIGATTALAGVSNQDQYNSAAQYRGAMAAGFQQSASQTLDQMMSIKNTLIKYQGATINVFVAHDLDFSAVGKRAERALKVVRRPQIWK